MSGRWLATNFIQCLRCKGTQRLSVGYSPIANPILFNSENQSRDYHTQTRLYAHHHGLDVTQKCECCSRLHSQWNVISHNQYLEIKEKAAQEEKVLSKASSANSTATSVSREE